MQIFLLEDEIYEHRRPILDALVGHEVTVATSADEAVARFQGPYDLLVLDHDMRGFYESSASPFSAFRFCEWICQRGFVGHGTRVILHSQNTEGRANQRAILEGHGASVDEYAYGPGYGQFLRRLLGVGADHSAV